MRIINKNLLPKIDRKKVLVILFLFCLLILFHENIEAFLSSWIIAPWLSTIGSNVLNDIIFVVGNVFVIALYTRRLGRGYVTTFVRVLALLFLGVIYVYYRSVDTIWNMQSFSFVEEWKYLDVLLIIVLGDSSVFLFQLLRKKKFVQNGSEAFVIDEPISFKEEDFLGRLPIAEDLAKRIENTNGTDSMAVGITGKWGSGKTSFLNLMKREMSNSDTIIVDFNPWKSLNKEGLIKDFFKTLGTRLDEYGVGLSRRLNEYADELLNMQGNLTNTLKSVINFFGSTDIQEQFKDLNQTLNLLDKQVIVFIDDVDRLDREEVVQVLKLIRNTGSFNRIKFIVAFDREYVIHSINSTNEFSTSNYLDKIFLQITPLPPIQFVHLQKMLSSELVTKFPGQKNEIEKSLGDRVFNSTHFAKSIITSVRDVKRFLNYFIPEFLFMKDEVIFDDYVKIKLLKYKFPTIYWELFINSEDYLQPDNTNTGNFELKTEDRNKTGSYVIRTTIESNPFRFPMDHDDIESAMDLIKSIFSRSNYNVYHAGGHLSIRRGINFSRYFKSRLDSTDFSERAFRDIFSESLDQIKVKIKLWVAENKKFLLMERLKSYRISDLSNREEFEKLIETIFYLGTLRNNLDSGSLIGFGYYNDDLYNKLYDGEGKEISNKFYNGNQDEYRRFLLSLFKNAESPYPLTADFSEWVIRNNRDGLPISIEEFKDITIKYFESYLASVSTVSKNHVWDLYHNCVDTNIEVTGSNSYRITVFKNKRANKLFIKFIKDKALDSFLLAIIDDHHRTENGYYFLSRVIEDIFGGFEKFHDFIRKFESDESSYLGEFKEFMEKLEKAGYKEYVPFEFNIIPVENKKN